jgi:WD40 repeat protein
MYRFVCGIILLSLQSLGSSSSLITLENAAEIVQLEVLFDALPQQLIVNLAFSPDNEQLAYIETPAGFADGLVHIFDISHNVAQYIRAEDRVGGTRLTFNQSGNLLIVGDEMGTVRIVDSETLDVVSTVEVSDGAGVQSIAVSPDNSLLAVGANSTERTGDYGFYLGSYDGDAILRLPYEEAGLSFGVAFNPIDPFVAYASTWHSPEGYVDDVRLFDISTGEELASCGSHSIAEELIITPDGQWLIYSATDGIRLWDMRDCETNPGSWHILRPSEDDFYVTALALHPIQPILAVGFLHRLDNSRLGIIELWNIDSGTILTTLNDITDETPSTILALAFSPDGTLLASGGADGTLRLWGIPAGG